MNPFEDESRDFYAVVNDEGQYALWPAGFDIPAGWSSEHGPASRPECLQHIELVWTDLRPRSLRERAGR